MKQVILLALLFGLFSNASVAQGEDANFNVGDTFTIAKVENNHYKHINFPKNNFIRVKGGLANYNSIIGEQVVIHSLKEKKNGKVVACIKLSSGNKFFMSHRYVTVDITEAISTNELLQN